jgi:hypothetical protein
VARTLASCRHPAWAVGPLRKPRDPLQVVGEAATDESVFLTQKSSRAWPDLGGTVRLPHRAGGGPPVQIVSRRSWQLRLGSRRAATGGRNDRGARLETVEDHDPRSCHRRPLTWRFSPSSPVRNTTQFLAGMPGTDLARRKPGVQIPSPPPPTSQVRASPASSRRRSLHVPAALRPQPQVTVQPQRLPEAKSILRWPSTACASFELQAPTSGTRRAAAKARG